MHDPDIVAFDIKYPWRSDSPSRLFPKGYRSTFITIWHHDPETDGSDDSCGYSFVKVRDEKAVALCRELAEWEVKWPYYFARAARAINPAYPSLRTISPGDAIALTVAAWETFAWRLFRERLSPRMLARAVTYAVMPHDNFQGTFVLYDDDHAPAVEQMADRFRILMRGYLTERRRWWQHPRWHVRHWRIQIHPLQKLRRFLFERCSECGRGFAWGESPCSDWHHTRVWHTHCDRSRAKVPA